MSRKWSEVLLEMGFFSALGSMEHQCMEDELTYVRKRTPLTYDVNNSTLVIYDEEGRPWIRTCVEGLLTEVVVNKPKTNPDLPALTRGAFVPHSNDGGYFMRTVLPMLEGREPWDESQLW